MNRPYFLTVATLSLGVAVATPTPTYAGKKWECAAWICAPVGFAVPYCGEPLKAMMKRVLKFKSPLPTFSSCTSNGRNDDGFSITTTKMSVYYPVYGYVYPPGGGNSFDFYSGWEWAPYEARLEAPKVFLRNAECDLGEKLHKRVASTIARDHGYNYLADEKATWVCMNKMKGTTIWNNGVHSEKTTFVSTSMFPVPGDIFNYVWDMETGELTIAVDHLDVPYEGVAEELIAEVEGEQSEEAAGSGSENSEENGETGESQVDDYGEMYEPEGVDPMPLDGNSLADAIASEPDDLGGLADVLPSYTDEQLSKYGQVESLESLLTGYSGYTSNEELPDDFSGVLPDYSGVTTYSAEAWKGESDAMLLDNNASGLYGELPGAAGELTNEIPDFNVDDATNYLNNGLRDE